MDERLKKQLAFALEIDKEKNIFRQTHLSGHGRNENDAEHAWHMAIMAYVLREYSNEKIDVAREDAAKERIFSLLPDEQKEELIALFDEFEAFETPESKFAHAMDNLQPLMLNNSNGGADWKEHEVTAQQVYGRQSKTRLGSEPLFEVVDSIIQQNIANGQIRED